MRVIGSAVKSLQEKPKPPKIDVQHLNTWNICEYGAGKEEGSKREACQGEASQEFHADSVTENSNLIFCF